VTAAAETTTAGVTAMTAGAKGSGIGIDRE